MFDDGYSEEIARRNARQERKEGRSIGDWVALVLAVPFAWLFWSYVAHPVVIFMKDVSAAAQADQARMETLKPMLGKCFKSSIGSVGSVIRIESGSEVKVAFRGGVTGYYPVSMLTPTDCPKD